MERFPRIYTNKLILRKLEVEDFPSLIQYANNKNISEVIVNIPHPYQEPNAVFRMTYIVSGFKKKERYCFAISLKENSEMIGEISLHLDKQNNFAELGYWVGEPFWNKGIITEAIEGILKFGFKHISLNLIFASCHEDNIGSQKVLLKNGLHQKSPKGHVIQFQLKKEDYDPALIKNKITIL